ncbi:MAG: alpha/beta hydrolase-fold protein [Balneolaceae bacterium]|nr:alpha/beta hydrolase-fold protein [Balneolaceae bacterium]
MKNVMLSTLIFLFVVTSASGQDSQRLKTITIDSEILEEERTIKVYLPDHYSEESDYPVIYITDGSSSNFGVASNFIDALSDPTYNIIPPSILVGIVHNNRNRDLNVFEEQSGIKFREHLFNEAVSYIDSNYSTSGFNAMIGHSNGAEYNQHLLIAENNPFRGFISMSTNFNTDVRDRLTEFFKTYEDKNLYYFIANGSMDEPSRTMAGNDFEALVEKTTNRDFIFNKKTYEANHQNIVPLSMMDGLRHIFKDYANLDLYPDIYSYVDNYKADAREIYGLDVHYSFMDLQSYIMDILMNKRIDEYEYLVEFITRHNLAPHMGWLDPVNRANQYFFMEAYPETIDSYKKGLNNIESVEARVFVANIWKAIQAYEAENRQEDIMPFLLKSREVLSDDHMLGLNYYIAKFSLENNVSEEIGKQALQYCKDHYSENRIFSMEDLIALEKE